MENFYDAVIIGGGPAGLTAAIYLGRAKYRVLVIEKEKFGGQITITSDVVNYPGVGRTSGTELTRTMRQQAEDFGAEFLLAEVKSLEAGSDIKKVRTEKGVFSCFAVLIATGAHPRMVGFAGEERFRGHGVAYCATCDGEFFTGKKVFVVGGGFAAAEEGVFLTKYASHVTILVRSDDFTCAQATAEEAKSHPKIDVLYNTEVVEVTGGESLHSITYRSNKTGKTETYTAETDGDFGVFVFAGYAPETDLVKDIVALERGYVVTDRGQKTSADGIYAAGDVCIKNLRQVVTAVGDGAVAATEMEKYAAQMQKKTGLKPEAKKETEPEKKAADAAGGGSVFSPQIVAQLNTVFSRMQGKLVLKLYTDGSKTSDELGAYLSGMADLTDKITVSRETDNADAGELPCVKVCRENGAETGLAFHGVPGGHEFTSFVLGLYNAAGPGQPLDEGVRKKIQAIDYPVKMELMVSLTCTMCPELVLSAQRIASLNDLVTAEVYDLNLYPERRDRYHVMSVPCFVINGRKPMFGKKNIEELLAIIADLKN